MLLKIILVFKNLKILRPKVMIANFIKTIFSDPEPIL